VAEPEKLLTVVEVAPTNAVARTAVAERARAHGSRVRVVSGPITNGEQCEPSR
jgi:hypothetical protein